MPRDRPPRRVFDGTAAAVEAAAPAAAAAPEGMATVGGADDAEDAAAIPPPAATGADDADGVEGAEDVDAEPPAAAEGADAADWVEGAEDGDAVLAPAAAAAGGVDGVEGADGVVRAAVDSVDCRAAADCVADPSETFGVIAAPSEGVAATGIRDVVRSASAAVGPAAEVPGPTAEVVGGKFAAVPAARFDSLLPLTASPRPARSAAPTRSSPSGAVRPPGRRAAGAVAC